MPALGLVWLLAMVPGVRYLLAYEHTAGSQGTAPRGWPKGMPQVGDAALPTLVVALHPRCSCSQATLAELEEAAQGFGHPYNAVLLIYRPKGSDYEWQKVDLYRDAQKALHARVMLDDDGQYSAAFGAETSGEVLYYSAAKGAAGRRLLFSGGVTGSRGMVGGNDGIEALKSAFKLDREPEHAKTPVFGCGLFAALEPQAAEKRSRP
ncbi:hypothetical protein [Granulicella tundricola]|uniref:RedB protein n=1 Tax=Granulicella tundricola (strain ATCC BAA-1859 / DSM 23138 / MP5ACTX9) TaxID=1198114 RepID=E8X472_GRATM|nr:hypothetical protein [Granulicella tundricola]ADW67132.1 hypothetical protein AciX9_0041 [Granulicella tundricola MP5ACTX9]